MPHYRRKQVTYSSHPNRAARAAHARGDKEFRKYDTSYIQPKKSKTPFIVALILAIAVIVIAVIFAVRGCSAADVEVLPSTEQATVVVEQGEGAQAIADTLLQARLIPNTKAFTDAVNRQSAETALIPGTYVFAGGTSPDEIVRALMTGPASTGYTVTIPEGYTRTAIAQAVEEGTDGHIGKQQFLDASSDASRFAAEYDFLADAGTNSLEGFLFPKTYVITASDDATAVVRMMLDQFRTEIAGLDWSYAENLSMNIYDAVKLASIVEKEAGPDNRATVASVFYNRLNSDRPYLESDATTAYEVGHEPTPDEVHADSPYSTYTNEGLPPTPICSPSLDSLKAVCEPEETDYLFFYFEPNDQGEMQYYFSRTYEEHQDSFN